MRSNPKKLLRSVSRSEPAEADQTAHAIALHAAAVAAADSPKSQSEALWSLPADVRHLTLDALPAATIARLIEQDPERNTALLANMPADKFHQILSLGSFEQGRRWLEMAVDSGLLAAAILPSLLGARDLGEMLFTSPDFRRTLPKLLNFDRAERWSRMLTPSEWHHNFNSLLMSDTDDLLAKARFKDKSVKAVLQSLLDFVPELYLETVRYAVERSKHFEESAEAYEDIVSMPLALPEVLGSEAVDASTPDTMDAVTFDEAFPDGADPVFALVTAGLTTARKAILEEQLRLLLRQEIVGTSSFSTFGMQRAAGRVLSYLRRGIESYGPSLEDATRALEKRDLSEVMLVGVRATEALRQSALALAGMRDWLDSRQRQFLDAMKQPEAGLHPETRVPILWLADKPKQDREDWSAYPVDDVAQRIADISTWAVLARAAFGTPERVRAILNTAKTRTADEALRRTVIALTLYRRWEPEVIRPSEDIPAFYERYVKGRKYDLDPVRDIVLKALDQTPADTWKPSDAKVRSRQLLLRTIDEMERTPGPKAS